MSMKRALIICLMLISFIYANSFKKGMTYWKQGQYSKAIPFLTKASNRGNKQATFYLANIYENGLGTSKNKKLAKQLYKQYATVKNKKTTTKKNITQKPIVKQQKKKYSKRLKKYYNSEIQGL